ncbi:MAG TPA: sulfite exporter TauE/SafE family protein [Terriglobales bacterium]|nr:sulfite exporter TauE/SafE family protein [Terriglobales bacterium]
MLFQLIAFVAAAIAGLVASIAGFGIGSILTPLLAVRLGTKLAVAAVSFPHLAGTLLRFWFIRRHVDRRVLVAFGIASAAGGLAGALLHVWFRSAVLGYVLGALLVFAGFMSLTGLASRMRFGRGTGLIAGALSSVFGGLVGNQGGIRSAALMGFDLSRESFVATATAIALLVDFFRMPVYIASQWSDLLRTWPFVVVSALGVLGGTVFGQPLLRRIPERIFRAVVSCIILALGIAMLLHPGGHD